MEKLDKMLINLSCAGINIFHLKQLKIVKMDRPSTVNPRSLAVKLGMINNSIFRGPKASILAFFYLHNLKTNTIFAIQCIIHSQKRHKVTEFCYDWYLQYTTDLHYIIKQKNTTIYESKEVPKACLEIDASGSHGSKYVFMINDLIL